MALQPGPATSFEFYDWNNILRTASTEKVNSGLFNTSDPNWIVSGLGSVEWLQYRNCNGDKYEAKIHCETLDNTGPVIRAWAETKNNGRTQGEVKGILITDNIAPPGWTVEFMKHRGNDQPVTFTLYHYIGDNY